MKSVLATFLLAILASASAVSFFTVVLEEWEAFKVNYHLVVTKSRLILVHEVAYYVYNIIACNKWNLYFFF